jgi:hypothetical protein
MQHHLFALQRAADAVAPRKSELARCPGGDSHGDSYERGTDGRPRDGDRDPVRRRAFAPDSLALLRRHGDRGLRRPGPRLCGPRDHSRLEYRARLFRAGLRCGVVRLHAGRNPADERQRPDRQEEGHRPGQHILRAADRCLGVCSQHQHSAGAAISCRLGTWLLDTFRNSARRGICAGATSLVS